MSTETSLEQVHSEITALDSCINVVIQIQSYGRVFVWDQLGLIRTACDPMCVSAREESLDERLSLALRSFLSEARKKKEAVAL
jgi:hypothetical protein